MRVGESEEDLSVSVCALFLLDECVCVCMCMRVCVYFFPLRETEIKGREEEEDIIINEKAMAQTKIP